MDKNPQKAHTQQFHVNDFTLINNVLITTNVKCFITAYARCVLVLHEPPVKLCLE